MQLDQWNRIKSLKKDPMYMKSYYKDVIHLYGNNRLCNELYLRIGHLHEKN